MATPPKAIRNTTMKRIGVPPKPKDPTPVPQAAQTDQTVAALIARVLDLEQRLAVLESRVIVDGQDVTINTPGSFLVSAAVSIEMNTSVQRTSSPLVEYNAGIIRCSGIVHCDTVIAANVVGSSYTPGVGNLA